MNLYSRCQARGCLPYSGGVLEQPAWIMELFDVIDAAKADARRAEEERQAAEAALKGKHGTRE